MLARSLERTGGQDEDGVRMLKDELREAVLKKEANRLGDFEDSNFHIVATLCDPRCNFSAGLPSGFQSIVGKKRDHRILDPLIFSGKIRKNTKNPEKCFLGKFFRKYEKNQKNTKKIRKNTMKKGPHSNLGKKLGKILKIRKNTLKN